MTFLIDTNVISELRKGRRMNAGVRAWIASADDEELFVSVLLVGELRQGIERIRLRDQASAAALDRWAQELLDGYRDRMIPIDAAVSDRWGRLNVPDPISAVDGLLAATALVHSLVLVTRSVRHIERTGVRHLNPFT